MFVCEGLLLCNSGIVIPQALVSSYKVTFHRKSTVAIKGSTSAKEGCTICVMTRVDQGPRVHGDLECMVSNYQTCSKMQCQEVKPLIPTPLPTLPWQKVGVDLFEYKKLSM